ATIPGTTWWACTCGAGDQLDHGPTIRPEVAHAVAEQRARTHQRTEALRQQLETPPCNPE
ncbi:hypothetical protein ACFQ07_18110, partial [Actinomadura adrarensis]